VTSTKTVASLVLPANNNVSILAATLTTAATATATATKTATATATKTATPTATATTSGSGACSGVAAWTDCCGCTYTAAQKVTYGSPASIYHATQTFTNTCGAGWNPAAVPTLWTLDGAC